MNKIIITLLFTILFCFSMMHCTSDKAPPPMETNPANNNVEVCDTLKPSFQNDIKPIFNTHCDNAGCHDQNSQQGGYVFQNYQQIMNGVQNGKVLCAIRHETGCTPMPQDQTDKLPAFTIQMIECWSENGAPDN